MSWSAFNCRELVSFFHFPKCTAHGAEKVTISQRTHCHYFCHCIILHTPLFKIILPLCHNVWNPYGFLCPDIHTIYNAAFQKNTVLLDFSRNVVQVLSAGSPFKVVFCMMENCACPANSWCVIDWALQWIRLLPAHCLWPYRKIVHLRHSTQALKGKS